MPVPYSLARLDRALRTRGEDAVLQRRIGTTSNYISVTVRCLPRGYKATELSGGVQQGDTLVILSPTQILAPFAVWPGAAGGDIVPKNLDRLVLQGRVRSVISVAPFYEGAELVRIELQVRG